MRRIVGLLIAAALLAVIAYVSRFWIFAWWGREGLLMQEWLRPGGDLFRRWLRQIDLGVYDVVLWAVAAFALLSLVQWIWDRLTPDD